MSPSTYRLRQRAVTLVFALLVAAPWLLAHRGGRDSADPARTPNGFRLIEVAAASGISFRHRPAALDPKLAHIAPYVAMFGASVAMVDADGDGHLDLYVTTSDPGGRNALYRNRGDGTFSDAAPVAGIADVNRPEQGASMGSVWADYDNDGDRDLLLYRWGYLALYRNEGNLRFTEATRAAGLRRRMNANAATWWDFDLDGDLDLYVAGYFPDDIDLARTPTTSILANSFEYATNGGHNFLYENRGDGTFADVTARHDLDCTRWTLALAAADFDGNGWPDLYLANDYGHDLVFVNHGGGRFTRADVGETPKSGMCAAVGDIGNDGRLAVFVSNISRRGYLSQGNNLWLDPAGKPTNIAVPAGVAETGWAWGAQFGDLDLDGRLDLVVGNGMISANRAKDYWYDMARMAAGSGRIFSDAANWPPIGDQGLSGYEPSAVFLNDGAGGFREVAAQVGMTDLRDGRGVALGDLDGDGDLDVVVANERGDVLLYRNDVAPGRHWIAFDLAGTRSNRDGAGAIVTAWWGDTRQSQPVMAGSGFAAQNPFRVHFGVGSERSVRRIEVRWPSGIVQEATDLAADRIHRIVEPGGSIARRGEAR